MPSNFLYLCHAFAEHPERSWVLCEREDGHEGAHRWRDFEWLDEVDDITAEERELLRRAEQEAGERYE
ncbi:hypothetical protein JY651_08090 [Pyxidicoccus parkwayensis]|uniref:Uncharacterized protein n=1 Tax=Pyxidicoccus parkwayensis TaxID=2813578 RepID=A0ABX7P351_9BACT|nr:hypothetical protein [Pyxidicoccus parkwaysis]QSQ24887.1 hypothetical protein JY651_08090 [Pyxidicoccus parkwaysis]